MITVILVEPENSGNIGAVARVMKNFGFSSLVLVNPKCKIDDAALNRAKHAKDVLENAKIVDTTLLKEFDYLIATTSRIGTDYNIARTPLSPKILSEKLNKLKNCNIGIVFGREGSGLNNEEVLMCDFVVTIPSSAEYGALNLSHAVGIILYELFVTKKQKTITPISNKEKNQILKMFDLVFEDLKFQTKEKKETQKVLWNRIIGKSFLSKREAYAMMGFLRKIIKN